MLAGKKIGMVMCNVKLSESMSAWSIVLGTHFIVCWHDVYGMMDSSALCVTFSCDCASVLLTYWLIFCMSLNGQWFYC